jgi:CRP-like cAMP-binding protein
MDAVHQDYLHQDVLAALRFAERPMTAGEVAKVVASRVVDAQDALGYLVRHGGARRHHHDDGVMRYSAVLRERHKKALRKAPTADAILRAIDAGYVRARDISTVCRLSSEYTSVVLHRLRARGVVQSHGPTIRAEWRRVAQTGDRHD